ncbi:hypothetical protein [Brevibacillus porteri]|uniref:hypothetical protein n=1 Tax=Brevibacillus porteri TaxID=2126350 RepID=UPI00362D892A
MLLLPVNMIDFALDSKYKKGDYIFAKDEKKVLRIVAMADETHYAAHYIIGGASRYFKVKAKHYRKATEDEVLLAKNGLKY